MKISGFNILLLLSLISQASAECIRNGNTDRNGKNYPIVKCNNIEQQSLSKNIRNAWEEGDFMLILNNTKIDDFRNIYIFPYGHVEHLIIYNNSVNIIQDAFTLFNYLYSLEIHDSFFLNGSYRGFKGLQHEAHFSHLNLSDNHIEEIESNAFNSLNNLVSLDLSRNKISHIHDGVFNGLYNLKNLNLTLNKIENLPWQTFNETQSLTELDLSYNKIKEIQAGTLDNLVALTKLNISSNNLISIHCEMSTHPLSNLLQIDLSKNHINSVEVCSFKNFESLTSLYLNNNNISEVLRGTFSPLSNLQELSLSNNQLSRLNPSLMFPLANLQLLDVSGNKLVDWDVLSAVSHFSRISHIDLAENDWDCKYLTHVLKALTTKNIDVKPRSRTVYHDENINGIRCMNRKETNSTGLYQNNKEETSMVEDQK